MSIQDEIQSLQNTKAALKQAITEKGVTVSDSDSFASYITKTNNIVTVNNSNLNITPSKSAQEFTPTAPKTGFGTVSVSAVTAAIDSNIVAANIKKDVSILGVTGTLESGTTPSGTITISTNGTYNVSSYASADVSVSGGGGSSTVALTIIIVSHPQMANEDEIDLGGTWYNVWTDFSWYSTVGNMGGMVHYRLFNVPKNTDIHYEDTQGYTGVINISEPTVLLWRG